MASPGHLVNQISIIALPQGAHRMAPLVPVPSASQLLQQAQGVQWMARVPSAPQVGSPHGRPYGWRRSCPSPHATSCLRRQAWLT